MTWGLSFEFCSSNLEKSEGFFVGKLIKFRSMLLIHISYIVTFLFSFCFCRFSIKIRVCYWGLYKVLTYSPISCVRERIGRRHLSYMKISRLFNYFQLFPHLMLCSLPYVCPFNKKLQHSHIVNNKSNDIYVLYTLVISVLRNTILGFLPICFSFLPWFY